jgi:hypothetical protein
VTGVQTLLFRSGTGVCTKDDGNVTLSVKHSSSKRVRHEIRLDHRKVAPDPLQPATNVPYSMSVYLVVDEPKSGYSLAEAKQIVDALTAYLTASSGARATQLLGGEN